MSELNKIGKVYTSDVLIIGAGTGALVASAKMKQLDSSIDILCVEKDYFGYNGQATKAGHGMYHMGPDDDAEEFVEELVRINNMGGIYLNDQEYALGLAEEGHTYIKELEDLGVRFTYEEDGSLHYHREFAEKKCSAVNIDLDFSTDLAKIALEKGVRILERVYFTDFLTKDGKVVGAVGFHRDTLEFHIFRAKAVVMAGNGFNPIVGGMFYSPAVTTMACFHAGAKLKNMDQGATATDLCHRNTKNFMYGVHWVIYNSKGENLFVKYNSKDLEMLDWDLVKGMMQEVKEGNYPLYIDFSKLPATSETEGEGFNMGYVMPNRIDLDKFIYSHQDIEHLNNPEISICLYILSWCLWFDKYAKTSANNLWALGAIGMYGCLHGTWVHGDGVGYACRTALRAAKSIVSEIGDLEIDDVDVDQILKFKERIYEPFTYKGDQLPYEIVHYLHRLSSSPENSLFKTEESIHNVLNILEETRRTFKESIYVPEGSGHHLFKAIEARTMIDLLEIMFLDFDMRKESRGSHIRADYPERDDKNMLKWIVAEAGEDGRPIMSYERIPFENYKWRPEGWSTEWNRD